MKRLVTLFVLSFVSPAFADQWIPPTLPTPPNGGIPEKLICKPFDSTFSDISQLTVIPQGPSGSGRAEVSISLAGDSFPGPLTLIRNATGMLGFDNVSLRLKGGSFEASRSNDFLIGTLNVDSFQNEQFTCVWEVVALPVGGVSN